MRGSVGQRKTRGINHGGRGRRGAAGEAHRGVLGAEPSVASPRGRGAGPPEGAGGGSGPAAALERGVGLHLRGKNRDCLFRAGPADPVPQTQGPGRPAQSPVLADLKIPASIFSFPLGLLPFFSPSFLVSSFLDGPFWQPLASFAHPPQGASHWLGGPKPCWAPCCSGTGWQRIQRPTAPLDSLLSNAH